MPRSLKPALSKASRWLRANGFTLEIGERYVPGFNPGIWLDGDVIVYAPSEAHPGDLLHEAGHLAVLPSPIRKHVTPGDIEDSTRPVIDGYLRRHPDALATWPEDPVARACLQSGDTEVIAWAYAAALAAGVDPWLTCEKGFGEAEAGETTFAALRRGAYMGINGLRASGFLDSTKDFPRLRFWRQP